MTTPDDPQQPVDASESGPAREPVAKPAADGDANVNAELDALIDYDAELHDGLVTLGRFRSPLTAIAGGAVIVFGLLLIFALRDGWTFFLQSSKPKDLGRIEDARAMGRLVHNRYVTFTGRPLLASEGTVKGRDPLPGCLSGSRRKLHFTLLAETGDRVAVRADKSLKGRQIPDRMTYTGRLLRFKSRENTFRLFRRFVRTLTDCRQKKTPCNKHLRVSADIPAKTLLGKVGKHDAVLEGIRGERIMMLGITALYLSLRFPGEYEYGLTEAKKEDALTSVKALKVPYYYVGKSGGQQDFILRPTPAVVKQLIAGHRRGKHFTFSERTAGFFVQWQQLERDGDRLLIKDARGGFPERYTRRPPPAAGQPAPLQLQQHSLRGTIRLPVEQLVRASYHGPRLIPLDAYVLITDRKPSQAWPAAVWAGFGLLMALGGILLIVLGLRRPVPTRLE